MIVAVKAIPTSEKAMWASVSLPRGKCWGGV